MYMTPTASAYYLTRVLPFMSVSELTKRLSVTRPTVERILSSKRIPLRYHLIFDRILYDLSDEFAEMAKDFASPNFYQDLSDRLKNDPEPEKIEGRRPKEHREEFMEEITPRLKSRKGITSKEAMALAARYNLPKHRVYRLMKKLGVTMDMKGQGRAASSNWYLS